MHAMNSVFVLYTAYRYAWDPMALGIFCSALGAVNIVITSQLTGRAVSWLGERKTLIVGLAAQVVGFTAVGLAPTGVWFWIANLPMALANIAGPALQAMMTAKVDPDEQGRLQGAMGGIGSLTGLFGPIAFTQVFALVVAGGRDPAWSGVTILLGAALSLVAGLLVIAYGRDVPKAEGEGGLPLAVSHDRV
jgi:DHA1 family tetracycline resistance protein-like MFS transporter